MAVTGVFEPPSDYQFPLTSPAGWAMPDQWTNTNVGDGYCSRYTNTPTGAAGSGVIGSDTAPTNDFWGMFAIELFGDGS